MALDTTETRLLLKLMLETEYQLRVRRDQIEAFCILLALDPHTKFKQN